jgi:hypothetical protein
MISHPNIFFFIRKISMEGQVQQQIQGQQQIPDQQQTRYARMWTVFKKIYGKVFLHRFFASQHINKSVYQILYL